MTGGIRVGQGFDVHRFGPAAERLRIGGVDVPHHRAFEAHSDGDVALHALTDAVLGAAALGDIGQWFPDSDPRWEGADSRELLGRAMAEVRRVGWDLGNADVTVIAQAPRLAAHVEAMRRATAQALGVSPSQVGFKATTSEGLGFPGREEGIAAMAVACLIERGPDG